MLLSNSHYCGLVEDGPHLLQEGWGEQIIDRNLWTTCVALTGEMHQGTEGVGAGRWGGLYKEMKKKTRERYAVHGLWLALTSLASRKEKQQNIKNTHTQTHTCALCMLPGTHYTLTHPPTTWLVSLQCFFLTVLRVYLYCIAGGKAERKHMQHKRHQSNHLHPGT